MAPSTGWPSAPDHRRQRARARRCCGPPRTVWPGSGRVVCTRSSSGRTPSPWPSGRRSDWEHQSRAAPLRQGLWQNSSTHVRQGWAHVRAGFGISPPAVGVELVDLRAAADTWTCPCPAPAHQNGEGGRLSPARPAPAATRRAASGGPDPRAPRDARDERHECPLAGAADPDARAVGDVVGDVQGRRRGPGRVPSRSARPVVQRGDEQCQRRGPARPAEGQPEHEGGRPGPRQRRRAPAAPRAVVPPPAMWVATRDGVAHQAAQAAGQDRRWTPPGRPGPAPAGGPGTSAHTASDQPETWTGASASPWRRDSGAGRRPVEGPAGQERPQRRRTRRARPCSPARSGRPTRPRPGATPGPRPRRRAAWVEEVGARRHVDPDQQRRARARRGCGSRAGPVPPGRPGPATSAARPVARPSARPLRGRTMRGATAATSGSSKWPSNGSSQPVGGTQSESTNATSAAVHAGQPRVAGRRRARR